MRILRQVLKSVVEHSQESFPRECCGILLAKDENTPMVDMALPAENTEKEFPEQRYSLDYKTHLEAVEMEATGEAHIVGYYHSHPHGTALPSQRDLKQAVTDVIYLIVGLGNDKVEYVVWRVEKEKLIFESLKVGE